MRETYTNKVEKAKQNKTNRFATDYITVKHPKIIITIAFNVPFFLKTGIINIIRDLRVFY